MADIVVILVPEETQHIMNNTVWKHVTCTKVTANIFDTALLPAIQTLYCIIYVKLCISHLYSQLSHIIFCHNKSGNVLNDPLIHFILAPGQVK